MGGLVEPPCKDDALVKALARAFRRKLMLDTVDFATLIYRACYEGFTPSFVTRIARTGPRRGTQGPEVTFARLMQLNRTGFAGGSNF
jgi:hypothetical protein